MSSDSWDEKTWLSIQSLAKADGFIVSASGAIRWTAPGLVCMRERFARIGVDIRTLKSIGEYAKARVRLSDEILGEISRMARKGKQSTERDLLVAMVEGNHEQSEQLTLNLRQRLKDNEWP
jgi:hypothetical protein